jgi:hypothetical protein
VSWSRASSRRFFTPGRRGVEVPVARVSWGHLLYRDAIARFEDQLASLQE